MSNAELDQRRSIRLSTPQTDTWSAQVLHTVLQRWISRRGETIELKDISQGGAALLTARRIRPRQQVLLCIEDGTGARIDLTARPVHSRQLSEPDGSHRYLTGVVFTPGPLSAEQTHAIERMLQLPMFTFSTATT
jgi:hypothetical protein